VNKNVARTDVTVHKVFEMQTTKRFHSRSQERLIPTFDSSTNRLQEKTVVLWRRYELREEVISLEREENFALCSEYSPPNISSGGSEDESSERKTWKPVCKRKKDLLHHHVVGRTTRNSGIICLREQSRLIDRFPTR